MEDETRKRKITSIINEEDEEDEEVKIEKFFALIRSAKDIRDQLLEAEEPRPPLTVTKAVAKADKKAVATPEKKTDAITKIQRKEKKLVDLQPQNVVFAKKDDARITTKSSSIPVASASGGGSGGAGGGGVRGESGGGGGGGGRVSKAASFEEEEKGGKKSEDGNKKKNYQEGKILLDLNLSL
ncbi:Meiotic nuclear division protein 1-like protein [Bienertia sinuspersici]